MSDKSVIGKGLFWKLAEKFSSQGVSFVVTVVLARLLTPEQHGTISMVTIFIVVANVFVASGLSTSLIQKQQADDLDFSTILYCNLGLSLVIYAILFFSAPLIADFYNLPDLTPIVRVLSLSIFISAFNSIQHAWVSKHLQFKRFFYSTLGGTIISGVIGVFMAYMGFGVWALVVQTLSNQLVNTIVLYFTIEWHSNWQFSFERAKPLVSYGWKILSADLIGTFFTYIRQLLIGKFYTPADLALYVKGQTFPNLISNNVDQSLSQVLFPSFSKYNDDSEHVKRMMRKSIKISSYISYFFMVLLSVTALPLIRVLLTDIWIGCVPYIQIFCIGNMLNSISNINIQAMKAMGKSDVVLKLELYKKPVLILTILLAIPFGPIYLALTYPVYGLYAAIVNMRPNKKILSYGIKEQVNDYSPSFILAFIVFGLVYPVNFLPFNDILLILIEGLLCFIIYSLLSRTFKMYAFDFCKKELRAVVQRIRN